MKTKRAMRMQWLVSGVLTACATAWAAGGGSPGGEPQNRSDQATMQDRKGESEVVADARRVRASRLIGSEVRDPNGRSLGHIDDLVLDIENERVRYAVLAYGGVLGVAEKFFAYPVQALGRGGAGELMLNVTRERLERAPGFERNRWPRGDDARYWSDVDRYFEREVPVARDTARNAGRRFVRASELIGKDVDDRTGANAGEIEDVVVSLGDGRLRYLVLEFDPRWTQGEELVTLPATAITMYEDRDAVLNVARERLDRRRGFDENNWPDLNDPSYVRRLEDRVQTTAAAQLNPPYAGGAMPTTSRSQTGAQPTATAQPDAAFLREAAQSGMAEVQASRLAEQRSRDEGVRRFARHMIEDHTKANERMRALAEPRNIALLPQPTLQQQRQLDDLRTATAEDFDERYLSTFGVPAHERAVQLFQQQANTGRDRALKQFAQQTLPTLHEHLRMARALQGELQAAAPGSAVASAVPSRAPRVGDARNDRERDEARETVREAVQAVQQMKADPRVMALLPRAKGVFILPDYGRGGIVLGGQGGQGVLVTRQGDGWSDPVFYNLAGASVGAQVGASAGRLAMLLMTDEAVQRFRSDRTFSLNADAGLTVGDATRRRQSSAGKIEDIVVWSDTEGLYAGASVGVTGVLVDREANRAYYGRNGATVGQILGGQVTNPAHNVLEMVLNV
jgi:lipid-binding SYLF domain-containing protein/predicted outer membrane protein/sporulation protein YlmC with PRC-barrel domain